MPEGTGTNRSSIAYNFEKYCFYTDYKWKLCPEYASANEIASVAKSNNFDRHFVVKEFEDPTELYNLFLTIPPNVPKSIHGLFKYWNWLLMHTPIEISSEDIPPPIAAYRPVNEHGFTSARHKIGISKNNGVVPKFSRLTENPTVHIMNIFLHSLDQLEKKFYAVSIKNLK